MTDGDAFYLPLGDNRYEPTRATESPWDRDAQHGGPPAALLAHLIDATVDEGLRLAGHGPPRPSALGAYSYLAVGQYTAFNGIQGRREGRLHFAGEQTSLNYQGYIEGALRSGYRCAHEIAGSA